MKLNLLAVTLAALSWNVYADGGCAAGGCAAGAPKPGNCPAGACADGACKVDAAKNNLDTAGLKKLVESGEKVVILDARSGKWDDGKRIAGAKQLAPGAEAKDVAAAAGEDKAAKIVTYCASTKCPASAKLAKQLREAGYSNVWEYPEGIAGWVAAGNKVDEPKK